MYIYQHSKITLVVRPRLVILRTSTIITQEERNVYSDMLLTRYRHFVSVINVLGIPSA